MRPLHSVSGLLLAMAAGFAAVVAVPQDAAAQLSSFQGIVTDARTGVRLFGAEVRLESSEGAVIRTALTDREGLYLMGSVAPGTYTLRVGFLGYAGYTGSVQLALGETTTVSIRLDPAPLLLEGIGVDVEQDAGVVIHDLGGLRITPSTLRRVPSPSPSADLASFVQVLPGVVTAGDRGGQIFVRGGTHTENLTLMDGVPVFQPFHIVGFFSAFPEDLVSGVDFYAGGFGARYNGRASSVMDVQMRDGDRNGYQAAVALSPLVAEARVEGPLRPGIAWLASMRRSLIEETAPTLLNEEQPLRFESQYFRLSSVGNSDTRCAANALRMHDEGRFDPEDDDSHVSWENVVLGGRCTGLFEGPMRFVELIVGYSKVRNEAVVRGSAELHSELRQLQFELNSTHLLGDTRFNMGYHAKREDMSHDLREVFVGEHSERSDLGMGFFAEAHFPIGSGGQFVPGFVATFAPTMGVEPRLRFSWPRPDSGGELTGALGLYRQTLTGVSDTRDVGSVFVAWLRHESGEPMTSLHAQLGWQQEHDSGVSWGVEGYLRRISNISVPLWRTEASFGTELGFADGRVYGFDAKFEVNRGPFFGFAGYGFSWTEYRSIQDSFLTWFGEPIQSYHPPHDRRHQANFLANYQLSAFELRGRWQIGSGLPYTRPLGFDEAFDFRFGFPDINRVPGTTRMVVDRPYRARLPVMHRLDLSIGRTFESSFGRLEVQGGAVNAYDRRNLFYYDIFTGRSVDQLPLVPYLAVKGSLQ